MLNKADNELLTRVESDAPMGKLIRRYWLPVMRSEDLVSGGQPHRVRLLGQNFVAFRDTEGKVGVLDELCPHRGASLTLARNADCTLQCIYHGWRINRVGEIVETPSEPADSTFKERLRHVAYEVREIGGLVWTHLGAPGEAPPFPAFEWTEMGTEHVFALRVLERCNWAQALEGVIDSAHIGFLHHDLVSRLAADHDSYTGGGGLLTEIAADGHPRLEIENTPYGFRYAAIRSATKDGERVNFVRTSHWTAPFWGNFAAPRGWGFQQAFVPIDDYNTMFYYVHYRTDGAVIDADERLQIARWAGIPDELDRDFGMPFGVENGWGQDRAAMMRGETFTGLYGGAQREDFAVQESMGRIFDRSREHLGTSDVACIRFRRLILDAARAQDEPGTVLPGYGQDVQWSKIRAEEGLTAPDQPWQSMQTIDSLETSG
jgi:phthalate 4,5-dioxygenase